MTPTPALGSTIKRARERLRISQKELAAQLGVNVKTVDNWENGRTSPKSSLGALEEALGISLSEPAADLPPINPTDDELNEMISDARGDRVLYEALMSVWRLRHPRTQGLPKPDSVSDEDSDTA